MSESRRRYRDVGPNLKWTTATLAFAGILLAFAGLVWKSGTLLLVLLVPVIPLAALVLAGAAAGLVLWKLRSRTIAWATIVVAGAECCCALALLAVHVVEKHQLHDRYLDSIDALAGLHGQSHGVGFEIRAVPGDRRVELRVTLTGQRPRSSPAYWEVDCYGEDVRAGFGFADLAHKTPSGATLDWGGGEAISRQIATRDHLPPFCSLEVSTASGADETFATWSPLRR
jgi:NADH:ubiquinone oxidoreductase subunit K